MQLKKIASRVLEEYQINEFINTKQFRKYVQDVLEEYQINEFINALVSSVFRA